MPITGRQTGKGVIVDRYRLVQTVVIHDNAGPLRELVKCWFLRHLRGWGGLQETELSAKTCS